MPILTHLAAETLRENAWGNPLHRMISAMPTVKPDGGMAKQKNTGLPIGSVAGSPVNGSGARQGGSRSQSTHPTIPRITPAPIAISGRNGPPAMAAVTANIAIACNREPVGFCLGSIPL
jgi:hypothetical protein